MTGLAFHNYMERTSEQFPFHCIAWKKHTFQETNSPLYGNEFVPVRVNEIAGPIS